MSGEITAFEIGVLYVSCAYISIFSLGRDPEKLCTMQKYEKLEKIGEGMSYIVLKNDITRTELIKHSKIKIHLI